MSEGNITASESAELDALHARVRECDPVTGHYYRWSREEHDRVMELMRKKSPWLQFAPSTEEMARRFGHLARNKASQESDCQPGR